MATRPRLVALEPSDDEEEPVCAPCAPEEAETEPPAKRLRGAKGVPASWYEPSVPWPGRGQPKLEGVRYHTDEGGERKYWLFDGVKHRRPVCICKDDGMCGIRVLSRAKRPGYADACTVRENRQERYNAAKEANDGTLPTWESQKAHKGHEHFVLHKGRECVTMPSSGAAVPLCKCGRCFATCQSYKAEHEYAHSCVYNPAPKC